MSFRFCVTQPGCEKALKAEVAAMRLPWKFAFSRPGFITFRVDQGRADPLGVRPSLARVAGESFGLLEKLSPSVRQALASRAWVGAVFWSRAQEETQPGVWAGVSATHHQEELDRLVHGLKFSQGVDGPGEVLHWIEIDPGKVSLGLQLLARGEKAYPGGALNLVLPESAPSRAWLKVEELVQRERTPIKIGDRVLEVGSSPGGMSKALLDRGCEVWGVDTGQMHENVLSNSQFHWVQKGVQSLTPSDLGSGYEWLVVDMNVRPETAVDQILRVLSFAERSLMGALLTLKVNDERAAEHLPRLITVLREESGFGKLTRFEARQLFANRNETAVYFETRKAQLRRQARLSSGSI